MANAFKILGTAIIAALAVILAIPILFAITGWTLLGGLPVRSVFILGFIGFIIALVVQGVRARQRRQLGKPA